MSKNELVISDGLSARQIKLIGCASMLFSHVGIIFWPYQLWWQIPGRIAMPLFAYMLAGGARHSQNLRAYVTRLLIFAALIQYPYSIFMGLGYMNICFTLGIGLLAIILWQGPFPQSVRVLAVLALGFLAELTNCEYGIYGILMIITAHIFFDNWRKLCLCWLMINLPYLWVGAAAWAAGEAYPPVQGLCLMALPFLRFYNGRRGGGSRWEFYVFYIGHLALLYGLRLLLWGY